MGKSFQIATIGGIPLKVHWTFPLVFVALYFIGGVKPWLDFLLISGLVMALFVCVILHEFGHVYAARYFGVNTLDVIISPIGGVARLTRLPSKPIQEFIVAIAGPLVNVVIALILSLILFLTTKEGVGITWIGFPELFYYYPLDGNTNVFIRQILGINLLLVLFNLIPAFPMDGGRMFRAILSLGLPRLTATRAASLLGQFSAVVFVIYGIYSQNYTLPIIGVFIFIFASNEYQSVKVNEVLKSFSASDVMRTDFISLSNDTTIEIAKDYLLKDDSGDFIIIDENGDYKGILTRRSIQYALKNNAFSQPITDFAAKKIEVIHPSENIKKLFYHMQEQQISAFVIQDEEGELLGIIDIKRFQEFLHEQQKKHSMKLF